jgi:hypothetical protein
MVVVLKLGRDEYDRWRGRNRDNGGEILVRERRRNIFIQTLKEEEAKGSRGVGRERGYRERREEDGRTSIKY